MIEEQKHYKFFNNETDNVICYISVPSDKLRSKEVLESTRLRLAIENGIYIGSIYYIEDLERETEK